MSAIVTDSTEYLHVEYENSGSVFQNDSLPNHGFILPILFLTPGTQYNFSIYLVGIQRQLSEKSCIIQQYTNPSEPAGPVRVTTNTTSISVQWKHPEGNVESYDGNVSCKCEIDGCRLRSTFGIKSIAHVDGLYPGTHCKLVIIAISGGLRSQPFIIPDIHNNETVPGPVSYFSQSVSSEMISLAWKPPSKPNGDLQNYYVSISATSGEYEKTSHVNVSHENFTFEGLVPGVCYNVSILAVNNAGEGTERSAQVYTIEKAPTAVENIRSKNMSSTSIEISWNAPLHPNGVITRYEICVKQAEDVLRRIHLICVTCVRSCANFSTRQEILSTSDEWCTTSKNTTVNITSTDSVVYNITGLGYFTNYSFAVRAYTAMGAGPIVNIYERTSEDKPSVVTNLTTTEIQETNISLEFNTPAHKNGHIISMDLEYWSKPHNSCVSETTEKLVKQNKNEIITDIKGKTYSTKIENLDKYWTYHIRVKMATNAGCGNWSDFLNVTTAPSVPDPVSDIYITQTTSRSISLQWTEPCFPNGIVKFYYIDIINFTGETFQWIYRIQTLTNQTNFTVTSLLPYQMYLFNISTKVQCVEHLGKNVSSNLNMTLTEAPFKPGKPNPTHITESSINLKWPMPSLKTGPTFYNVTAVDSVNNTLTFNCSAEGFFNTSCMLTGLDSYWNYSITVSAVTGTFPENISEALTVTTKESAPGKVTDFSVVPEQNISKPRIVLLRWEQPLKRDLNGIIRHYFIEYWHDTSTESKETIQLSRNTSAINIPVKPERNYTFQIFAETVFNASIENYQNKTVPIKAGAPLPVFLSPSVLPIIQGPPSKVSDDEKQVSVSFNPQSLCNDQNGHPVKWYIIVSGASTISKSDTFQYSMDKYKTHIQSAYKTWSSVHDNDVFAPYIATDSWKPDCATYFAQRTEGRTRRSTPEPINFVVGSEEDCKSQQLYCNGYLKPKSSYKVRFTVCTITGCLESKYSAAFTTEPNLVPVIAGSVSGVIVALIVIVVIAVVVLRRRSKGPSKGKNVRNELGNQNRGFATEMDSRTISKPRPIKITEFAEHVVKLHADSNLKFSSEYKMLKENSPSHPTTCAEDQGSRIKNRYTNILAYDHSRVKLLPIQDEEGSDYINANYMPGFNSQREFIATQGPLQFTKDDFWRMIWEQNVTMIVMLTQLVERGRRKCDLYWPEACKEPVYFGDLVVEMDSESVLPDYVLRIITIKLGKKSKRVKHLHYLKWPDMGCPETTSLLLNFIGATRIYLPYHDPGPIIVHCSAGVGRTGTFIAVDHLMHQVKNSDVIDIYSLVLGLRNNRPNMVQTEDQYIFIHDCIKDFIAKQNEDSDEEEEEPQYSNEPLYANA